MSAGSARILSAAHDPLSFSTPKQNAQSLDNAKTSLNNTSHQLQVTHAMKPQTFFTLTRWYIKEKLKQSLLRDRHFISCQCITASWPLQGHHFHSTDKLCRCLHPALSSFPLRWGCMGANISFEDHFLLNTSFSSLCKESLQIHVLYKTWVKLRIHLETEQSIEPLSWAAAHLPLSWKIILPPLNNAFSSSKSFYEAKNTNVSITAEQPSLTKLDYTLSGLALNLTGNTNLPLTFLSISMFLRNYKCKKYNFLGPGTCQWQVIVVNRCIIQ